jgi:Tfp pilus assembly protein PilO
MKRQMILLVALGALALVAAFWMLLWQPQRAELAEVEEAIAAEEATQAQLQGELDRLRSVREQAPAVVAELAAAESVIPLDAALPSALRQLQTAADESQLTLVAVAPARPAAIEGAAPGMASIALNVQVQGSYFQVVDFLRRTEDASISPRAMLWNNVAITKDDYPTLTVALTGSLYALLPAAPPPVDEAATPEAEGAEVEDADAEGAETDTDDVAEAPEGADAADETTEVTP